MLDSLCHPSKHVDNATHVQSALSALGAMPKVGPIATVTETIKSVANFVGRFTVHCGMIPDPLSTSSLINSSAGSNAPQPTWPVALENISQHPPASGQPLYYPYSGLN